MAIPLTDRATALSQQSNIGQQLILEIDGIPLVFSAVEAKRFWRIGDDGVRIGDPGLTIGGMVRVPGNREYISLGKTTNRVTQQIQVDRGGAGSVSKFKIELVDKDQELTRAFRPGENVTDILGREAIVYLGFAEGSHPEDSVRIFNGIIDDVEGGVGNWTITAALPEAQKRQEIFINQKKSLVGAIDNSTTSITLNNTDDIIQPDGTYVLSYVRIDDEVIQFTSHSSGVLNGVTRAQLGTVANAHDAGADVETVYRLQGKPMDLALRMMLSGSGQYVRDIEAPRFVDITPTVSNNNAIFFPDEILQERLGLSVGDLITIEGAANAANNVTSEPITAFLVTGGGTAVFTNQTLTVETGSSAVASFASQYDTLPAGAGLGMTPKQVDVTQHLFLRDTFASNQIDLDFYLKETVKAKEFIADELYFPAGFYQVPRKGRASVQITAPPLVLEELKEINHLNVTNPADLTMRRSINKYFHNAVIYNFNEDILEDEFLASEVIFSQRSIDRIPTGNKPLTLESKGLRDNSNIRTFVSNQAQRYADRFQFAAESTRVQVLYKDSFNIEVADTVLFGSPELQLVDTERGTREFRPRLMEVINKSLNIKEGRIELSLLDTGFGIDGRFGVIAPSSLIGAGSTTTSIVLKQSFAFQGLERQKYENLIGEEVTIHNDDWTFVETVTISSLNPTALNTITVTPALSVAPSEDFVFEVANYPDSDDDTLNDKSKSIHVFFDPQVDVVSGASQTQFTVSAADRELFLIGSPVRVHNGDFTDDSTPGITDGDAIVTAINTTTNEITVSRDLGFTPDSTHVVDLIGFKDNPLPYRIL